jgi:hypothetical protein
MGNLIASRSRAIEFSPFVPAPSSSCRFYNCMIGEKKKVENETEFKPCDKTMPNCDIAEGAADGICTHGGPFQCSDGFSFCQTVPYVESTVR